VAFSSWQQGAICPMMAYPKGSGSAAERGCMTAVFDTVRRLVERLGPAPICDACVAERLALPADDALHAVLGELAVERGFDRERGPCSLCDTQGSVIRKQG